MSDRRATVAVIGGSGFYDFQDISDVETIEIATPFGAPSDSIVVGTLSGVRVAFLPRHGAGHRILPGELPQLANIWALASLGVERIISVSAVGSLKEGYAPLDVALPDQLIDRTSGTRPSTFFGGGIVAHIAFDTPFCPSLRATLVSAAPEAHRSGTLVVIEGPAFSTRAESELYRSWNADLIGMTALPEAKLAREAGICYAALACVTDYDTWHPHHESVTADLIIANLLKNVAHARRIVAAAVNALPSGRDCACAGALATAIVTPMDLVPEQVKRDLAPILARRETARRARRGEAVAP
jgi:5'-methylthioadenosine phosphorylase